MTSVGREPSPAPRTMLGDLPAAGSRRLSAGSEQARKTRAFPVWVVPPVVTLAVALWGIGRPAYSRDEAATLSAAGRPFGEMVRMLHNVDVVHGTYYAIIWVVVRLAGPGELATRLPSALAAAVAAAAVFGLGRRLVSARAGLAAGLVFAAIPYVSYFGQTARPYALETALAAIASYLLVRVLQAAACGDGKYGWLLAGYGASLTALGYVQFLGLLLAAAHLVPVLRVWLQHRAGPEGRQLAVRWLAAVLAAVALVSPVIQAGIAQRSFGSYPVNAAFVRSLAALIGTPRMAIVAGLAVLAAVASGGLRGRARADWPAGMIALCVPWLTLPPLILIVASHGTTPLYTRYLVFCAPAAAVLLGAALAALGWITGTAVLAIFATLAVPALLLLRTANGHGGSDIVAADQIIARYRRPGDVLVYKSIAEAIEWTYPYGMRQLNNIEVGQTAIQSATLGGLRAPQQVVQHRAEAARRIWAVQITAHNQFDPNFQPIPPGLDFTKVRTWHYGTLQLTLYIRH